MLDHLSIPVADFDRAVAFYTPVLATLGMEPRKEMPGGGGLGFGPPTRPAPVFWLMRQAASGPARPGVGLHVSFEAASHAAVDAFYESALTHGARSAGAPGPRPEYTQPFYGAFVLDPEGWKIEAVCRQ